MKYKTANQLMVSAIQNNSLTWDQCNDLRNHMLTSKTISGIKRNAYEQQSPYTEIVDLAVKHIVTPPNSGTTPLYSFLTQNSTTSVPVAPVHDSNYVRWKVKGAPSLAGQDPEGNKFYKVSGVTGHSLERVTRKVMDALRKKTGRTFKITLDVEWFVEGDVLKQPDGSLIIVQENPEVRDSNFDYKVRYL